jgi:uncharacterized protein YrrD
MLKPINELNNYKVLAVDGVAGHVHDIYFDDAAWIMRYLVVDTGTWLPGRKVLISPLALERPNWETNTVPVNFTQVQIENSPEIDTRKPVSHEEELKLLQYFQWPDYWQDVTPVDAAIAGIEPDEYLAAIRVAATTLERVEDAVSEKISIPDHKGDPNLRSTNEVTGYHLEVEGGRVGQVEDFIYDDNVWTLRYLLVDTGNWWPDKKILVAPQWIEKISRVSSVVQLNLSQSLIENSPEYDPSLPISRSYERKLFDHYGRSGYWS